MHSGLVRTVSPHTLVFTSFSVQRSAPTCLNFFLPRISTTQPCLQLQMGNYLVVPLLLSVLVVALVKVLKKTGNRLLVIQSALTDIGREYQPQGDWGSKYHGQGNVGDNDSVQGAGGVAQGLALVTVGVVLVLVDLATLVGLLPGHGTLANADVALGGDGGGLSAEVPVHRGKKNQC